MEVQSFGGFEVKTVTEADMATASSTKLSAAQKRKSESDLPRAVGSAIDEAAAKILERMEVMRAREQPSTPPRPAVIELPPTQIKVRGRAPQQLPFHSVSSSSDTVTIRVTELQQCADACYRAAQAAKHAQRLSASAAQAFGNESQTLEQCGEILKTMMDPSMQAL